MSSTPTTHPDIDTLVTEAIHLFREVYQDSGEDLPEIDREKVRKAVEKSLREHGGGNNATENVFCPTGEGGGVDPSCSPLGQSAPTSTASSASSQTSRIRLGRKEYTVTYNPDGSTRVDFSGNKKIVSYTIDGVRHGYVEDAKGGNVEGFTLRRPAGGYHDAPLEVVSRAVPQAEIDRQTREAEAKSRQEKQDKVTDFERKVGYKVLSPQDVIHTLKSAGVPVYKKPRPNAGDPGQSGVDVNAHPTKKTGVFVEYKSVGGEQVDYAAKASEMHSILAAAGYTIEKNPAGDPSHFGVRKPIPKGATTNAADTDINQSPS